ncbi:MAG: hypothetical protein AAF399_24605 [Bacteroidota bacterium]
MKHLGFFLLSVCPLTGLIAQLPGSKGSLAGTDLLAEVAGEGLEMGQLFLPILLAVVGFIAKTIWDIHIARRNRQIQLLQQKLSLFYWPIAVRFQQVSAIWEKMFDNPDAPHSKEGTISATIKQDIILEKHNEIVKIIENGLHIVEPSEPFREVIGRYLKHVAMYNAIVRTGIKDRFPKDFDAKFPKELIPQIEGQTRKHQNDLNRLLKRKV